MFELNQQCTIEDVLPNRGKNDESPLLLHIRLLPLIEGHFAATFTITVEDPSAEYLHYIANAEHTSVDVRLVQDVRELELEKPADEEKKPGKVSKRQPPQQSEATLN